jgi:hypothetical protein
MKVNVIKKVYDDLPETFNVPENFIHKKGQIIIIINEEKSKKNLNKYWPEDFINSTYGSLKDDPMVRLDQGIYPDREILS